ncbi:hypothetical protein CHUAL_007214 [Chamberlinius hualienensis]
MTEKLGVFKVSHRKKRIHFTAEKDILLLKLVIQHKPFEYGSEMWKAVSKDLIKYNIIVDARTVKLRCAHLLELFQKESLATINKSGTEEQYNERALLLKKILKFQESPSSELGPEDGDVIEMPTPPASVDSLNSCSFTETLKITKRQDKLVADKDREQAQNQLQTTIDERKTYMGIKNQDDVIRRGTKLELDMKEQEMHLKRKQIEQEIELKRKQIEEEIELKRFKCVEEIEIKKKELELEEKRLNIEEKRLNIEETKQVQANALQQLLNEQQKVIMEMMLKIQKNDAENPKK